MECECYKLPRIFNEETHPNNLSTHVELVEEYDGWWKLYRCTICNQHWQIDVVDKLQVNCAIKIDKPAEWRTFSDKPIRMQYLISSRGGLSENECRMANCGNKALVSLEYCPEHAYSIGLRE